MRTRLFGLFGLTQASPPSDRAWPAQPQALERRSTWTSGCGTALTLRAMRADDAALLGELF